MGVGASICARSKLGGVIQRLDLSLIKIKEGGKGLSTFQAVGDVLAFGLIDSSANMASSVVQLRFLARQVVSFLSGGGILSGFSVAVYYFRP